MKTFRILLSYSSSFVPKQLKRLIYLSNKEIMLFCWKPLLYMNVGCFDEHEFIRFDLDCNGLPEFRKVGDSISVLMGRVYSRTVLNIELARVLLI
jgi:hypothetical protein